MNRSGRSALLRVVVFSIMLLMFLAHILGGEIAEAISLPHWAEDRILIVFALFFGIITGLSDMGITAENIDAGKND